jgi:hypothetical protein
MELWCSDCKVMIVPTPGDIPNGSGQASRIRWSQTLVLIIQYVSIIVETLGIVNIETGPKL